MKELYKIEINSEKLMKNEKLLALKGGVGDATGCCMCKDEEGTNLGAIAATSANNCSNICNETWDPPYFGAWGKWSC